MNSRAGGLMGGARGEEGMLSQMAPVGLARRGVRGAAARSSEREATRSREGREAEVPAPLLRLLALNGGDAVRVSEWCRLNVCSVLVTLGTRLTEPPWCWLELVPPPTPPLPLVKLFAAVLRSVWRLFWNHIVTDFISLFEMRKQKTSASATFG